MDDPSSMSRDKRLSHIAEMLKEKLSQRKETDSTSFGLWLADVLSDDDLDFLSEIDFDEDHTILHNWIEDVRVHHHHHTGR